MQCLALFLMEQTMQAAKVLSIVSLGKIVTLYSSFCGIHSLNTERTLMSGKYLRTLKTYHVNVDGDIIEDTAKSITAA